MEADSVVVPQIKALSQKRHSFLLFGILPTLKWILRNSIGSFGSTFTPPVLGLRIFLHTTSNKNSLELV